MSDEGSKTSKSSRKSVIEEVREKKSGHINPVLITFQNGELNENYASDFNVILTPKECGGTNVEVKTSYGHTFKDINSSGNFGKTQFIAIRNRKTNKIKLVEIDTAVLLNAALLNSKVENVVPSNYAKDLKTLHKSFGGKRVVNQVEQRDKLNTNSMLVSDEMKETIAAIKVEETLSVKVTETESIINLLPPCNRATKTLSEVYSINNILNEEELESLKENILKKEDFKPKQYSKFFFYSYEEAKKSENNLNDRLAGVLFIETIIQFLKIPSKKLATKNIVLCPFSNLIHAKLMHEFCIKTKNSLTRPLTMKDKGLCYIITLCLICCNYQINLKLLAEVTAVHLKKMSRLARIVGAVPVSKDDHIYVLKLPLPALPTTSKGNVKRK